jgi:hypothetical protein
MARDLHANFVTELGTSNLKPFFAVKMEFATVTLRLWTGYGDITISTEVYKGMGDLMQIGNIEESQENKAVSQDFIFSGIPTNKLYIALQDNYSGKDVTLFMGLLNESNGIINNAYTLFKGFIDTITINESGETATIRVRAENRLVQLERSIERRYTSQQQKFDFAGDEGLDLIEELIDKDIKWKNP